MSQGFQHVFLQDLSIVSAGLDVSRIHFFIGNDGRSNRCGFDVLLLFGRSCSLSLWLGFGCSAALAGAAAAGAGASAGGAQAWRLFRLSVRQRISDIQRIAFLSDSFQCPAFSAFTSKVAFSLSSSAITSSRST
jgi:hypothetical protein